MIKKKKLTIIFLSILFLVVTPLTVYFVLNDGNFDIRSRADYNWETCIYSKADMNNNMQVDLEDFGIWLENYRYYKENNRILLDKADITDSGSIKIEDFVMWLQLWRQFKDCKKGLEVQDTSKCADGCYSTTTPTSDDYYTNEEFELNGQKVAFYYPSNSNGQLDSTLAPFPIVVFHHGMGAKYDYYTWLAEELALDGYLVLMPNRPMFEMDMEAATTVTTDLLSYLEERNTNEKDVFYQRIDFDNVVLAGHSLGSGLSLFASESLGSQIKALVLLSSGGQVAFDQSIQIPGMDLFTDSIPEMEESFERMRTIVQETNTPILYIIGSNDKMISPEGTKELYSLTNSKKVIAIIEGGNHVQFVQGGAMETMTMKLLDGKATISPEEQRSIGLKYINAWLDYLVRGDSNGRVVLENGVNDVPTPLSFYEYSL